ncbi:MAG: C10 family peptidase, partial [Muribaculaceae bacterium]|nr:C10 family peptidase [Muribaculaceae bacterium]
LTPAEALERALAATETSTSAAKRAPQSVRYEYSASRGSLYLFEGNNGQTLVTTSDSRLRPVLAKFDSEASAESNPALEWWLNEYEREISDAMGRLEAPAAGTPAANYAEWYAIQPLVKSKWDQGSPYNALCPSGCVTGCVATAMAQVIYTNRYALGTGQNSYYTAGQNLSFDFGNTDFDFAAMTDTYNGNSSAAARKAVATLMLACGVSVNMNYSPGGSGASDGVIGTAFTRYFGYDSKYTQQLWRPQYQTSVWESAIYNELKAGRPVIYGGTSASGGGHCFVVDGYSDNGLFHINWGWSGNSDGYFALSVLSPFNQGIGSSDVGYNCNQYAILVVKPGAANPPTVPSPSSTKADVSKIKITDIKTSTGFHVNQLATVSFTMVNTGASDFNDFIHLGLFSDEIEYCYSERPSTVVVSGDASEITMTIKLDGEKETVVTEGSYTLRIQDHWRQVLAEYQINVTDGKNDTGWNPGSMSCYVTNGDKMPQVVISGSSWSHIPQYTCTTQQSINPGLNFYKPDTDEVVAKMSFNAMTIPVCSNRQYKLGGSLTVNVPWGEYDVCYTFGGKPASARSRVRVGTSVNGLSFAPASGDDKAVSLASGNYSGDLTIPAEVTIGGATRTVTAVEPEALAGSSVTSVSLPATINAIGINAMRFTGSMRTLMLKSAEPPFEHEAFFTFGMHYNTAVYVPADSYDDYASRFLTHTVYSTIESISGPEEPIRIKPGETVSVAMTTAPADGHINPMCIPQTSPSDIVLARGLNLGAITLTGLEAGTATVTIISMQPGVMPASFKVIVDDGSALSDLEADADDRADAIYDLQGRRLQTPVKGLNIINRQ